MQMRQSDRRKPAAAPGKQNEPEALCPDAEFHGRRRSANRTGCTGNLDPMSFDTLAGRRVTAKEHLHGAMRRLSQFFPGQRPLDAEKTRPDGLRVQ